MEVNMIILPKNNSDINLGMKKQIKQLFENLFNNVNDSSFEINLDNNVKIEYKISSKEKNMVFLKLSCNATPARAAKYLDNLVSNRIIIWRLLLKQTNVMLKSLPNVLHSITIALFISQLQRMKKQKNSCV